MSGVQKFKSESVFQHELRQNTGKIHIVKFTATWCGPCKSIAPLFESLSHNDSNSRLGFVEIDVDDSDYESLVSSLGVKSMPTFIAISFSEERGSFVTHGRFSGADKTKLTELVEFCKQ